jgi:disulfide bond formation protein DsbB
MTTPPVDPAAAAAAAAAPAVDRTPLVKAQWTLAKMWFIGAGIILVILIARTMNQVDPSCTTCDTSVRFTWFGSAFAPTLLLIAGAISGTDASAATRTVSTSAYKLTLWVSVFYLLVALLPSVARFQDPAQAIKTAAWIPAIQGVVALLLGRLFAPSSR